MGRRVRRNVGRLDPLLHFLPVALLVVFYAAGSLLAWSGFGADVGLAFFPPAGITTAALILSKRHRWPLLLTAVFLTEVFIDLTQSLELPYALGYGVANTAEPLVGVLVFDRLNPNRVTLEKRRGTLSYILGACGAGGLAGALIGGIVATRHRPQTDWTSNVAHWWAGDGLAILALGASIVLVATTVRSRRRRAELAIGTIVTAFASVIALSSELTPATIILPFITILAFRLGPAGATVGGTVFALVANYSTNAGQGYFADVDLSPTGRLALLQVFIAVLVIVGWSIGVEVLERLDAVRAAVRLERQRDEATTALKAIHRAIGPNRLESAGPFSIGSCYRQSSMTGLVGGDWFDAFELPDDRLMFVVGDVVGHGFDAMEDMAHLRLATRAFAHEGHDPPHILRELSLYTRDGTRGRFATIVVGVYDPDDQALTLATAGHPPPLIRRRGTLSQYVPLRPGVPLGVLGDSTYAGTRIAVSPGDLLVLFTDGVIERRGMSLDDGFDELRNALDSVDLPTAPDAIGQYLIDNCLPDIEPADDRCILVLRVAEPSAAGALS